MSEKSGQKMPARQKGCLIIFLVVLGIFIVGHIPAWVDDAKALRNRAKVMELIAVGRNLSESEDALEEAGFRLLYDEAIMPTINKDYLQQGVIVGNTTPNTFESLAYAMGVPWMPFCRSVSPYVMIDAHLDGSIKRIH